MQEQRDGRGPGPSSWTSRARHAGGRVLGHAGQALGEPHLGTEALVAFVDGELGLGAHQRAAAHLADCVECSDEVRAQVHTRSTVRGAAVPALPQGLLGALRGIPGAAQDEEPPPPQPPRGVVLDEHGAWIAVLRPDRFGPQAPVRSAPEPGNPRRVRGRGGLGLVVVGVGALAVGVLAMAPAPATGPAGVGAAPVRQAGRSAAPTLAPGAVPLPDGSQEGPGPTVEPVTLTPQTATSPVTRQAVTETVGPGTAHP